MKRKLLLVLLILGVLVTMIGCGPKDNGTNNNQNVENKEVNETNKSNEAKEPVEDVELLVYSGAGLKKSMEEIKDHFEKDHPGVSIQLIYAGSGQLLAQLEQSGKGDVFIVGSKPTFDDAAAKDLTMEGFPVAHHTPCIVTAKDNPHNIETLEDLEKDGIKVALGDPEANAIGKTAVKIFEKNNIDGVEKNVVVKTGTVNDLFMAIESGNADVAIVTKDGAFNNQDTLHIIDIPEEQNVDQIITASTLKSTEQEELANDFVSFLQSEEAKIYWENHGFKPVS
ncbi:MAG: molybdate ABC transporter substrate-binding protein [Tissierellia bacterium]|nr:molybdate ABC transporter substrate-binding protein [Tissierellia bacterium]